MAVVKVMVCIEYPNYHYALID